MLVNKLLKNSRHGTRLDAADKQWHLTSPTPYDPPLTYGGWRQCHTLGARIARILHKREAEAGSYLPGGVLKHPSIVSLDGNDHDNVKYTTQGPQRAGQRKHRVVFHTSPFLRCIQTSIAISAGLAEAQTFINTESAANAKPQPQHTAHHMHSGSPHIRAMEGRNSPQLTAISEPEEFEDRQFQSSQAHVRHVSKPLLRTDAFLGEWLSPGYFEDITHPPDSVMMVAGAKASLLREKPHSAEMAAGSKKKSSVGNFPGGWNNATPDPDSATSDDTDGPLARLSGLNHTLPRLNRSSSHSIAGSLAHRSSQMHQNELETVQGIDTGEYISPKPSYAISPMAPIPSGYVAHAKSACLDVDYQWDSMRPPHEWGDGGQYGEEWSSMHKRFRRGLQQMILWYGQSDFDWPANGTGEVDQLSKLDFDDEEDDTDLVLVLVTHSAGCNALMGALTNQPVLLDAGMASLTMAVRRPDADEIIPGSPEPLSPGSRQRRSSIDFGISELYEVKFMASVDHLRGGTITPTHRSGSLSSSYNTPRYRSSSLISTSSSLSETNEGVAATNNGGYAASGNIYGSSNAAAPHSNGLWTKPDVTAPTGLWGSPVGIQSSSSFHQRPVDSDPPSHDSAAAKITPPVEKSIDVMVPLQLKENDRPESGGLWGASPPGSPDREKGPKRRWTHTQER